MKLTQKSGSAAKGFTLMAVTMPYLNVGIIEERLKSVLEAILSNVQVRHLQCPITAELTS